jgi:heptosyltransferase-1
MRILVVRLSALGDLVHTLPAVAALRRRFPDAEIDWLVDERFLELVDLVPVVDNRFTLTRAGAGALSSMWRATRALRRRRYDVAIDLQGLVKSALAARLSRARRVLGFEPLHVREPAASWLYTQSVPVAGGTHVIEKNLALVQSLIGEPGAWEFPIAARPSDALTRTRNTLGLDDSGDFVLLNPGAAWPSKSWEAIRYGALAKRLWEDHRLRSAVLWGPGEEALAHAVSGASDGAATAAPITGIADLVAHVRAAAVVVAGDTGPLHLAAAVGTPVVGIYGPSDPERNGPWSAHDQVVSAGGSCQCRLDRQRRSSRGVVVRQCSQSRRCLDEIAVEDVLASVQRRLSLRAADG